MFLEIGDKVAVLDAVLKGKVIGIMGAKISVATTDGMVFQFHYSELVRIEIEQWELLTFSDINNSLLKEKISENSPKKSLFRTAKKEVVMEVDLHVEKLTKCTKNMDNYEMLTFQLNIAKNKIEFAISKRISRIVFIHGVGKGVLKSELCRLLNKYPVKYYDASYKKYGFGATEVFIFQNTN